MEHDEGHLSSSGRSATERMESLAGHLGPDARVGVLTGAGISAASGVPTFRGADGIWKNQPAERLATPEGFGNDPALVWEWYGMRREKVRKVSPNAGHYALMELARRVASLTILTQNVDGLHADSRREDDPIVEIVELHGCIWRMRCLECGVEREDRRPGPMAGELPRCECEGLLRPAVVWFGEALGRTDVDRAEEVSMNCDVFLVVGTSAVVQPAASFASIARRNGAKVAEFNLEATELSPAVDFALHAPSEHTLPALVETIDRIRESAP